MQRHSDAESQRAEQYNAMAVRHATVTCVDRRNFETSSVRYMNNFVKACMIDTACRAVAAWVPPTGMVVADIACGRGQDASKWRFGAAAAGLTIQKYYGMDLSEHDCGLAARYLDGTTRVIHPGNMGTDRFGLEDGEAHVVSCQLALHYLCDAEVHVAHFFAEAARVLHPRGLLLVSFADGRAVVRRGRDAGGTFVRPFYRLDMDPAVLRARLPSPFGCMYTFTLQNSVHGVPEYLCHEGAVVNCAQRVGFTVALSKPFDALACFATTQPRFKAIATAMDGCGMDNPDTLLATMDVANLYRFMVMCKTTEDCKTFVMHLKT